MRGDPNRRLTILTEAEKVALYGIPEFDDFQRIPRVALNLRHCLRREAKSPSPSTPGTHAATIYANLRIFHLPTRSDPLRQTS